VVKDLPSRSGRRDLPELEPREQGALRTLTPVPGPRDLLLFTSSGFSSHESTPIDVKKQIELTHSRVDELIEGRVDVSPLRRQEGYGLDVNMNPIA